MSGNTTAIERLLEVSNKLWDAMYKSGEVPTYVERFHYYLALKEAMDEDAKLRERVAELEAAAREWRMEQEAQASECRNVRPDRNSFKCSECGGAWYGVGGNAIARPYPKHCPNCGRKVVDE